MHGVVYGLKFVLRAESPRDYVDIIQSFKLQPNIIIVDMANMVVAHGNKRFPEMFSPHAGMVCEPTDVNVDRALEGNLNLSMPWIHGGTMGNRCESTTVNGQSPHLCLFDRFHEKNVTRKEEVLRRVYLVAELKNKVNTQVVEQLHAQTKRGTRFLNQMKAVNHIFVFRSIIDFHNKKISDGLRKRLLESGGVELRHDDYGRVRVVTARPDIHVQHHRNEDIIIDTLTHSASTVTNSDEGGNILLASEGEEQRKNDDYERENAVTTQPNFGGNEDTLTDLDKTIRSKLPFKFADIASLWTARHEKDRIEAVLNRTLLFRSDLMTFNGCGLLNDAVMDCVLFAICEKSTSDVTVVSSQEATKWFVAGNYNGNTNKHTLIKTAKSKSFLSALHVCSGASGTGNHWILLISDAESNRVCLYDPMGQEDRYKCVLKEFRKFLRSFSARKYVKSTRPKARAEIQQDGFNCGALVLKAAEVYCKGGASIPGAGIEFNFKHSTHACVGYRKTFGQTLLDETDVVELSNYCIKCYDETSPGNSTEWIECDNCCRWTHTDCCHGLSIPYPDLFFCEHCHDVC